MVETLYQLAMMAHAQQILTLVKHDEDTCYECDVLQKTAKMIQQGEDYGSGVILYIP